jgi:hypothetical protein
MLLRLAHSQNYLAVSPSKEQVKQAASVVHKHFCYCLFLGLLF